MTEPDSAATPVWPFDIGIVGIGIVGTHQLTREAEAVIRRCNRTFVIADGYGIPDYLATLCPQVTDLAIACTSRAGTADRRTTRWPPR